MTGQLATSSPLLADGVALDVLVRRWWEALDAAQAALRSARHCLAAEDLGERSRRFTQERTDVLQLLRRLRRDWQTESALLDGLLDPAA
jgi:sirohydrochlorin ferrochelatase